MSASDEALQGPDVHQYYRTGSESFWRTDAAADPGQQVQFLNSDGKWESAIIPTAADFIGEGYAEPISAADGAQAAQDRQRAEMLAARGVHPHVHQFRDITATVQAGGDYDAPIATVEVEAAEVSVSVYVSPMDGLVVVQVDQPDEAPHKLRINVNERRLFGDESTRGGK